MIRKLKVENNKYIEPILGKLWNLLRDIQKISINGKAHNTSGWEDSML